MDSSKHVTTTEPNKVEKPKARVLRSMAVLMQAESSVFESWPARSGGCIPSMHQRTCPHSIQGVEPLSGLRIVLIEDGGNYPWSLARSSSSSSSSEDCTSWRTGTRAASSESNPMMLNIALDSMLRVRREVRKAAFRRLNNTREQSVLWMTRKGLRHVSKGTRSGILQR